jgi:hypothetical protein
MQTGRVEPRMVTNTMANLQAAEEPLISETVVFENISEHGARLITRRRWPAGIRVIISDALVSFRTGAEVVYCARQGSRRFAVGLKFDGPDAPGYFAGAAPRAGSIPLE